MAVVTRKSTVISNRDATPQVASGPNLTGGLVKSASGFVTSVSGDSAGSIYPMLSIPSNARVKSLALESEAQGTSCTADVGVFCPTQVPQTLAALNAGYTSGAAISAAFFASQVDVSGAVARTEVVNQSGTNTLDKQDQELWQALGLASDPMCSLDIAVKVHVATAAAGKIGLKCDYVN